MLDTEDLIPFNGKFCKVEEGEVSALDKPADEEIVAIVGANWPGTVPGSQRFTCDKCGEYVSLAPLTVNTVLKPNLRRPIICLECLTVVDELLEPMSDEEGMKYLLKLSEKRNGGPVV